jgi:hypothetical protein
VGDLDPNILFMLGAIMVEGKGPATLVEILFANVDINVDVGVEIVLSLE